jgi:hypothetical protein
MTRLKHAQLHVLLPLGADVGHDDGNVMLLLL